MKKLLLLLLAVLAIGCSKDDSEEQTILPPTVPTVVVADYTGWYVLSSQFRFSSTHKDVLFGDTYKIFIKVEGEDIVEVGQELSAHWYNASGVEDSKVTYAKTGEAASFRINHRNEGHGGDYNGFNNRSFTGFNGSTATLRATSGGYNHSVLVEFAKTIEPVNTEGVWENSILRTEKYRYGNNLKGATFYYYTYNRNVLNTIFEIVMSNSNELKEIYVGERQGYFTNSPWCYTAWNVDDFDVLSVKSGIVWLKYNKDPNRINQSHLMGLFKYNRNRGGYDILSDNFCN